jgi:hypothetical protein
LQTIKVIVFHPFSNIILRTIHLIHFKTKITVLIITIENGGSSTTL